MSFLNVRILRRAAGYAALAAAIAAHTWWFASPGESVIPLLAGPILAVSAYNVRHEEEAD